MTLFAVFFSAKILLSESAQKLTHLLTLVILLTSYVNKKVDGKYNNNQSQWEFTHETIILITKVGIIYNNNHNLSIYLGVKLIVSNLNYNAYKT